jgi:hypothetical protein
MKKPLKKGSVIYQLKVTLKDSKPPIWRRLQVSADTKLSRLHWILQDVMGWTNSHMHQFKVGQTYYGEPMQEEDFDVEDEGKITLGQAAPGAKKKFVYEYDFGDFWEHDIVVEKVVGPERGVRYPFCVDGKRACPPEDCGGVWGYEEFLEAIRDPNHPEHEDMLEWVGGEFDAEEFDLDTVNQVLKHVK